MFARMNNPSQSRSKGNPPAELMRNTRQDPLPKNVRNFLSDKISKNIREGKPRDQAIAISFSQTRKKFPDQAKRLTLPSNPHTGNRFRGFLIGLVGLAITLRILRELRR